MNLCVSAGVALTTPPNPSRSARCSTLAKRATALAFAALPTRDGATRHLLLVANAFGDVYAYPLPDVSSASRYVLGHCASNVMDIVRALAAPVAPGPRAAPHPPRAPALQVLSPSGDRLLTADREEQVRVSDFPFAARMRHGLFAHTRCAPQGAGYG